MLEGPKATDIQSIFSSVAQGYDKANDVMTLGMARAWKKKLVKWSCPQPGYRVLDCATGTGDLALEFKKRLGPDSQVVGADFCKEMLEVAELKSKRSKLKVDFKFGDATDLEFVDNAFDVASIAYGIRNVENPVAALKEMARVVRPGGRVMILETGDLESRILNKAIGFYFRNVVPRLGGWVTGQRKAYEYLSTSSSRFPSGERFVELMRSTEAFLTVECKVLMGGASFLYRGVVK